MPSMAIGPLHLAIVFQQLLDWMDRFAYHYGYLGLFLVSLLGAGSIIIPIPYTLVIYFAGHFLDPFLIALVSGLGSAVGEMSGYALGYYGRAIISEERKKKMDFVLRILNHYGPVIVFLFALTPLADDLLFIPLGIIRYHFVKAFVPCVLGKVLMSFVIAMSGKLSIHLIKDLFGDSGWLGAAASAVALIAIIVILLRIDWESVVTKHIEKKKKS